MTPFMRMRESIRNFIRLHETGFTRAAHGLYMLVSLFVIARAFPFAESLNKPLFFLLLSALGVFMPLSAEALILILFLLVNLFALSGTVCAVAAGLIAAAYLFCAFYRAGDTPMIPGMICARQLSLSCLVPMGSGLRGSVREVVAVFSSTAVAFFLQEVHANSGLLTAGEGRVPIEDFLRERVIANPMFYFYLLALTGMFLVVYAVRTRNIPHAWMAACFCGVSVEFLVMLSGYLFVGSTHSIPMLIFSNLLAILEGLGINYLYQDLDYSRIEKVQFEDDEYYYYVTAVPKIRLAEEKKEVRHINKVNRRRRERSR